MTTLNYDADAWMLEEIIKLKILIHRFKGVGIYQDKCLRWIYFVEAYELALRRE